MTPGVRKCALVAHVTSSVGWLGAVLTFVALAIAGVTSDDAGLVTSAYLAMAFVGWYVIVPFSLAALLSGVVQAIGTEWGLFRHYWIVIKLLLTIGASALLPLHLQVATRLSSLAVQQPFGVDDWRRLRLQIAVDAAAAVLVLVIATTLSVYKPWGRIEFAGAAANPRSVWGRYALTALAALVILAIVLHLTGSGARIH